ncbi:MAG TPA: hypothetical protein PKC45_03485, partial [Gemmatales bacterium]|nr:hypothetical protein [Gemmatales bacterium]
VRWPRWPWFGAWGLRGLVVAAAAVLLTPAEQRAEEPWLLPAVGGVMLLAWAIGRQTARSWPKGWPALLAACMAALGAGVMLHAHSARLTDLLLVGFGTLAGIGLSARFLPGDQGPALAAAALWLPGLALTAHHETFSDVPTWGLALVGLAPLGLAALLPAGFLQRWGRVVFGLACLAALAPVGAALFLAVRAVTLEF